MLINKWEIKSERLGSLTLNVGETTVIFDEHNTQEETYLYALDGYFKSRGSNDKVVSVLDVNNGELIPSNKYVAYIYDNSTLDGEHKLAASSLLSKKVLRESTQSLESEPYINSINVLVEDLLSVLNLELPLTNNKFDLKAFIKLLEFSVDEEQNYLYNRLRIVLPKVIQEMMDLAKREIILIYLYPESGLSSNEQIEYRKFLDTLPLKKFILTSSPHFIATNLFENNWIVKGEQIITEKLIEDMYWECPLNYSKEDITNSLFKIFKYYLPKLETNPRITNHELCDIILFDPLDIYTLVFFLKNHGFSYDIDLEYSRVPDSLAKYLKSL